MLVAWEPATFHGVSGQQHRDSHPATPPAKGAPLWVTCKMFRTDFGIFWVPLAELEWNPSLTFKRIQKIDGAPLGRLSPNRELASPCRSHARDQTIREAELPGTSTLTANDLNSFPSSCLGRSQRAAQEDGLFTTKTGVPGPGPRDLALHLCPTCKMKPGSRLLHSVPGHPTLACRAEQPFYFF